MLWATILTAFFGFLRSSELLALQHSDVTRRTEGYYLSIKASKTDPFRWGATVVLSSSTNTILCPVAALDHFLAASPSGQGPVFCFSSGAPLTRPRLNALIRELAVRSGVPPERYSSHSFRIGAASTAAAAGIPDWKIQALGRWSSDCYRRYIRLPGTDSRHVSQALARSQL